MRRRSEKLGFDSMAWGQALKEYRLRKGISFREAERMTGLVWTTWYRYETGRNVPALDAATAIVAALDWSFNAWAEEAARISKARKDAPSPANSVFDLARAQSEENPCSSMPLSLPGNVKHRTRWQSGP